MYLYIYACNIYLMKIRGHKFEREQSIYMRVFVGRKGKREMEWRQGGWRKGGGDTAVGIQNKLRIKMLGSI